MQQGQHPCPVGSELLWSWGKTLEAACPQGQVVAPTPRSLAAISAVRHLSAALLHGLTGNSWPQLEGLGVPAQHLLVCFWGGQLGGIVGLGQAWKQDSDGLEPWISDCSSHNTTQACLKRGIAVGELGNGSGSHRYFSGACRVPPHLLGQECWVLVSVLGWVQQQLPLVQDPAGQVALTTSDPSTQVRSLIRAVKDFHKM